MVVLLEALQSFSAMTNSSVICLVFFFKQVAVIIPNPTSSNERCNVSPLGWRGVLHRCPFLWQHQPLYKPPLRAKPHPGASLHVASGPPLSQDRLLQHEAYRSRRRNRVGAVPGAATASRGEGWSAEGLKLCCS